MLSTPVACCLLLLRSLFLKFCLLFLVACCLLLSSLFFCSFWLLVANSFLTVLVVIVVLCVILSLNPLEMVESLGLEEVEREIEEVERDYRAGNVIT